MKKTLFTLSALAVLATLPVSAEARSKAFFNEWYPSHWKAQDFKPYVENFEDTVLPLRSHKSWQYPKGMSADQIMTEWKRAKLIEEYEDEDGISTLTVGYNFYHLSSKDKRRMISTADDILGITYGAPKVLYLKDWNSKKMIGHYTMEGLSLF